MKALILFMILLIPGCGIVLSFVTQFDCSNIYIDQRYEMEVFPKYSLNFNKQTPNGIQIDTSGLQIDLEKIDSLTNELSKCLNQRIRECGFRVKIAPDSKFESCAGRELFPCKTKDMPVGCEFNNCPCGCAGIVQYPSTAIVTPDLAAFKHELIHVVTHKPHSDPVFNCQ